MPLSGFHPTIERWFGARFAEPTEPQRGAWPIIQAGRNALIAAPTGSGKTFAAFLAAIDSLLRQGLDGTLRDETQVVYVSPLKALSNDVQKNLAEPLAEIRHTLEAMCLPDVEIRTLVRTGDTPAAERQAMVHRPPHILVTTPESLFLILTSEQARRMLRREDQKQRLGRRDEDVRRPVYHCLPLRRRRVAGANERPDLHVRKAHRLEGVPDLGERLGQVLLNVVGERLQGRDVHHLRFVPQRPVEPLAEQGVDRRQEGGERFARARGRRDQRVAARLNDRPRAPLRLGWLREPRTKPALDRRVKAGEWHGGNIARLTPGRRPGVSHPALPPASCPATRRSARSSPRSCCSGSRRRR